MSGGVMSAGAYSGVPWIYIGHTDVGPYRYYVRQCTLGTLYHAMTLPGVKPPTVVPEADVILQC